MSSASHRGVDGPVITGQMANVFMSNRDDDATNPMLQTDRERLNELHAELAEPSANALPMTPVRAGRQYIHIYIHRYQINSNQNIDMLI